MAQGVGVILVAAVLFGSMALFVQMAAAAMPPAQIAFVRFTGSLIVLLALTRGRNLRPRPQNRPILFLRSALGAVAIVFYYTGIEYAGAGFATLLQCTYPVPTALFAAAIMGEAFSLSLGAALALSLTGVFLVLAPGHNLPPRVLLGGLSALAASVLAGGAVTAARHLRRAESASLITIHFMAIAALMTAPSLLLGLPEMSWPLALALTGVVLTSAGGQWLFHHGLGFASAAQGSLTATTSVVTAATLEAAVLGHYLGRDVVVGGLVMIVAVALAGRASSRRGQRAVDTRRNGPCLTQATHCVKGDPRKAKPAL